MTKFLKINSIAMWSLIAGILNLGPLFGLWSLSAEQLAGINTAYISGIMALRQMFSVTAVQA